MGCVPTDRTWRTFLGMDLSHCTLGPCAHNDRSCSMLLGILCLCLCLLCLCPCLFLWSNHICPYPWTNLPCLCPCILRILCRLSCLLCPWCLPPCRTGDSPGTGSRLPCPMSDSSPDMSSHVSGLRRCPCRPGVSCVRDLVVFGWRSLCTWRGYLRTRVPGPSDSQSRSCPARRSLATPMP